MLDNLNNIIYYHSKFLLIHPRHVVEAEVEDPDTPLGLQRVEERHQLEVS